MVNSSCCFACCYLTELLLFWVMLACFGGKTCRVAVHFSYVRKPQSNSRANVMKLRHTENQPRNCIKIKLFERCILTLENLRIEKYDRVKPVIMIKALDITSLRIKWTNIVKPAGCFTKEFQRTLSRKQFNEPQVQGTKFWHWTFCSTSGLSAKYFPDDRSCIFSYENFVAHKTILYARFSLFSSLDNVFVLKGENRCSLILDIKSLITYSRTSLQCELGNREHFKGTVSCFANTR